MSDSSFYHSLYKKSRRAGFYLKSMMVSTGILKAEYQRFVVLTSGRTGSTMLIDCLNQNPQISANYEIFSRDAEKSSPFWQKTITNLPIRYLQLKVYGFHPRNVQAVGFKMHYYHCQNKKQNQVWDYLCQSKEIKIIHLKRNILETFISGQMARKYNAWHVYQEEDLGYIKTASVWINPEDCLKYFEEISLYWEKYKKLLVNHPVLEVWYENLYTNMPYEMECIQSWLGVTPVPVQPMTYKQVNQPLEEIIENYSELLSFFQGTAWESCFPKRQN